MEFIESKGSAKTAMKILTALLIATATLAMAQTQTQPRAIQPEDIQARKAARLAAAEKLQTDMDQAMSRANLTEQQRQEFTSARQVLRKQALRHKGGEKLDRATVRQAMQTIRGLSASNSFQPEDRETMKRDLQELRNHSPHRKSAASGKRKSAA
jgi:dihydroorotase-like cyclic amidohydrolase